MLIKWTHLLGKRQPYVIQHSTVQPTKRRVVQFAFGEVCRGATGRRCLRIDCHLRRSAVVTSSVVTVISRRAPFALTNFSLERIQKDADVALSYLDKFCGICVCRVREMRLTTFSCDLFVIALCFCWYKLRSDHNL